MWQTIRADEHPSTTGAIEVAARAAGTNSVADALKGTGREGGSSLAWGRHDGKKDFSGGRGRRRRTGRNKWRHGWVEDSFERRDGSRSVHARGRRGVVLRKNGRRRAVQISPNSASSSTVAEAIAGTDCKTGIVTSASSSGVCVPFFRLNTSLSLTITQMFLYAENTNRGAGYSGPTDGNQCEDDEERNDEDEVLDSGVAFDAGVDDEVPEFNLKTEVRSLSKASTKFYAWNQRRENRATQNHICSLQLLPDVSFTGKDKVTEDEKRITENNRGDLKASSSGSSGTMANDVC
ncbi:hypothetical protein B0H13DRAFT_1865303 [Mycena leptocephala]|nr:hypothetical protein B0H13DRAFT_1865303 [Mycena leptocephala]